MKVVVSPTHFTIKADGRSVVATSLSVTWTESAPAGRCIASGYTYHGFFDF